MTLEKFYETLRFIVDLDGDLRLQANLDGIKLSLANLVASPAATDQQTSLASGLREFAVAVGKMVSRITPSQMTSINLVGGAEFFDPAMAEKVQSSVSANAMTPSVAKDFVQDFATRRAKFLTTINQTIQGLQGLGVTTMEQLPGSADIAFLIPRDLFDNKLGPFAKELTFISRMVEHYSEAITGEASPVVLEGLSSSIPTIALNAGITVISAIGDVVNKFLDAWEKIQKIRRIRSELTDIGMSGKAVEELTEQIETTVTEVVEESVNLTIAKFPGDAARRHELETALAQDTRRLFGQIERGLTIEFRAKPKEDAEEDEKRALESVDQLSRVIQFPQVPREPMLLESGEILEGELKIHKVTKKTTETKTKKVSKGSGAEESTA